MMERHTLEYLANAFWQLPLLAAGAWLLLRTVRPAPAAQHRVWLAVLGMGLLLPLHGGARVDRVPQGRNAAAQAQALPQDLFNDGQPGSLVLGFPTGGSTAGFPSCVRRVYLSATLARWILGLYLIVALFGLLRIAWAWKAARRLVEHSREVLLRDRERAALEECARRVGVPHPQVRESRAIAGPVVVGVRKPVLLLPRDFTWHSNDEWMAALCHEMAHIRRRDYLANLLCEGAVLPLRWHPATYAVERRIRSTREMACDAMAAEAMQSETTYARCLLSLAQSMAHAGGTTQPASAAAGLFNGNALEERVMRLMHTETAMSLRARIARGVAGAAAMACAIALAGVFHVIPAMAQAPPAAPAARPAPQAAAPAPPAVSAAPDTREEPLPKVAPLPPLEAAAPLQSVSPLPPLPAVKPLPQDRSIHHRAKGPHGRMMAMVNGQERELTPEEQQRVEKQLEEAQRKIAEATARLNSPEFRRQIEEARRQAAEAASRIDSGELQRQMENAKEQIADATARLNSPEFRKQLEDAQQKALNSAQFQKQMDQARRQVEEATAKLNSPEFRKQIEDAQRQATEAEAKIDSGELQKQIAAAQKQLRDELEKMKTEHEKNQTE